MDVGVIVITNINVNDIKLQDTEIENAYLILMLIELRKILGSITIKKIERPLALTKIVSDFHNWCSHNSKLFYEIEIICNDANNTASMIQDNWYGVCIRFKLYHGIQVINHNLQIKFDNETGQMEVKT